MTDKGRETTYQLGQRLRNLYVNQLGFMPKIKADTEDMYLRATTIPRALESLQQAFWGMYPPNARTEDLKPPVIVARSVSEETLFPNESNCRRFRQLARLFADRAAQKCMYQPTRKSCLVLTSISHQGTTPKKWTISIVFMANGCLSIHPEWL